MVHRDVGDVVTNMKLKPNQQLVLKLVQISAEDGKLKSYNYNSHNAKKLGSLIKTYSTKRWTTPIPGTKLLALKLDLQSFDLYQIDRHNLWLAIGEDVTDIPAKLPVFPDYMGDYQFNDIVGEWHKPVDYPTPSLMLRDYPTAIACSRIKLVRPVEPSDTVNSLLTH